MKQITAIVLGAGGRGNVYAAYSKRYPNELKIVGVAEPDEDRRKCFQESYGISDDLCVSTWEDLLAKGKIADVAIICTMDRMHYGPAMKALSLDYDLLLEKPISPSLQECEEIAALAKERGRKVLICHVLRYTPFFKLVKKLVSEGAIGDLVSIQHNENVGYLHQAHSFVRGNWRNSEESSPMILQKCCHDMDILQWIADSEVTSLSSFGGLRYFKEENAPEGAPKYCLEGCPHSETCPYYAPKTYLSEGQYKWMRNAVAVDTSAENMSKVLTTSPYGRCVFRCDNDVVDHQVVNMKFANDVTVAFTMCGFTQKIDRTMKLMGTKGEMRAKMSDEDVVEIFNFETGVTAVYRPDSCAEGHGGGDDGIMRDLVRYMNGYPASTSLTEIQDSVRSHRMAFDAERSRVEGIMIQY